MRILLVAGAALLALNSVALADDNAKCAAPTLSIADHKAAALAGGMTFLGIRLLPFTGTSALFYTQDGETFLSLVFEDCVEPKAHDLGAYVAEPDV